MGRAVVSKGLGALAIPVKVVDEILSTHKNILAVRNFSGLKASDYSYTQKKIELLQKERRKNLDNLSKREKQAYHIGIRLLFELQRGELNQALVQLGEFQRKFKKERIMRAI